MLTLVAKAEVKAPPGAVWRVLTDYTRYHAWTGAALIAPDADRPGGLTYTVRVRVDSRPTQAWRLPGREVEHGAERRIVWRFGVPGFLRLTAEVDLAPTVGGTEARHVLRLTGLAPLVRASVFRRVFQSVADQFVRDLAAQALRVRRGRA